VGSIPTTRATKENGRNKNIYRRSS